MYDRTQLDTQPWYTQFWPWLLISLPASAVFGGFATLYLAIQSPNALVVDDYYKAGLAINQVKHKQALAQQLQIEGLLRSDGKNVQLTLSGNLPISDNTMTLNVIHSTRAELDQKLILKRQTGNNFSAPVSELMPGIWYLRLEPEDQSWEIRDRLTINGPFQAQLKAKD
jgi:hypothetical protein